MGEAHRRCDEFAERAGAEGAQSFLEQPEGAGHGARQRAAGRHRVETGGGEGVVGEAARELAGAVERHRVAAWLDVDQEAVATGPALRGLDDEQHERGRGRGVHRARPLGEQGGTDGRGPRIGGRDRRLLDLAPWR